jgi:hypothetical protein
VRPPPSPWVEAFISILAFIAPEWGLFAPACVSAGGLCLAEGPVCGFVSASKISVPRSIGDRFDNCMASLQLSPNATLSGPSKPRIFGKTPRGAFLQGQLLVAGLDREQNWIAIEPQNLTSGASAGQAA